MMPPPGPSVGREVMSGERIVGRNPEEVNLQPAQPVWWVFLDSTYSSLVRGGSPLYRTVLALKAQVQPPIAHILPWPEASLLGGALLGVETDIPEGVEGAFYTGGTVRVLAVFGFNNT